MDLSIIIVNFNTAKLLQACLQSVFEQTVGIEFEIFVVDNASTDDSVSMIRREFPNVHLIVNESNRGFAAANNQAIPIARGRYILLLNSDTKVLDGAIQKTVEFMQAQPEASIVGCKLLNADGSLQPSCMSFPSVWNLFSESLFLYIVFRRSPIFGAYYMSYFDHDEVREVDFVRGAFMMIRREVFDNVGLFDEAYFMYTEEVDLCYRARKLGYRTFFSPSAQIIHYGGGSIESMSRFSEQLHLTQFYFIRKHFQGLRRIAGAFVKGFGLALRVPVYAFVGLITFDIDLLRKSRSYFSILWKVIH